MAFVKLDTGILNSTLWIERDQREVFITALLMAEPREFEEPIPQIKVGALEHTGFIAPPGWYGFVPAASFGIINRAGIDREAGLEALRKLGEPELESRSKEFEGRRMIRMNGGFIILNFMKYRDKDHTAAERQRRLRARRKAEAVTRDVKDITRDDTLPSRNITQAEAEAEAEAEADATKKQKPSRAKRERPADELHQQFKEAIKVYWDSKNRGVDMPWGPAEGKQLGMFLREAPQITLEQFKGMLRGRYKSDVNHGDRPSQWIRYVTSYAAPVDRYNRPANSTPDGAAIGMRPEREDNSDTSAEYKRWLAMPEDYRKAHRWIDPIPKETS